MKPFDLPSMARAVAIAATMAFRGHARRSLTPSGSIAAFAVGFLSLSCGSRGGFLLLLFYAVATKATKYKSRAKSKLDHSASDSSCRGHGQVLACSALGVAVQLAHVYYYGAERSIDFVESPGPSSLACALVAHHATSLADTLSSELGMLSKTKPVLITNPGRTVPHGTNGGVTLFGTGCGALGGLIIGIGATLLDTMTGLRVQTMSYIVFGTAFGVMGSLVDSLMGATLQVTHFDPVKKVVCNNIIGETTPIGKVVRISGMDVLTNAQVNVASIIVTSAAGAVVGPFFFR